MTLKDLRLKRKLTQKEASEEFDITPEYLSMLERGDRNPSDELKEDMARVYKTTVANIFLAIKETKRFKETITAK